MHIVWQLIGRRGTGAEENTGREPQTAGQSSATRQSDSSKQFPEGRFGQGQVFPKELTQLVCVSRDYHPQSAFHNKAISREEGDPLGATGDRWGRRSSNTGA